MKSLTIVALLAFLVAFAAIYFYNSDQTAKHLPTVKVTPPYAFSPGETIGEFNAFFFVFIASLLLFGIGGIVSMLSEGAKYGYFASKLMSDAPTTASTSFTFFDLLFILPLVLSCIAATTLAAGLIMDYRGKGSMWSYWSNAAKFFGFGLALLVILIIARPFVVVS